MEAAEVEEVDAVEDAAAAVAEEDGEAAAGAEVECRLVWEAEAGTRR